MMKKLLAILLCLSLIFALAACSKPESQTQQPAQTENQPEQTSQAEQPSEPEALTYPIEQFTVGTTAVIETATFGLAGLLRLVLPLDAFTDKLEFKNVSFSYVEGRPVLNQDRKSVV